VNTVSLPSRLVPHGIAEIQSPAACGYRIVTHRGGISSLVSSVGARHESAESWGALVIPRL